MDDATTPTDDSPDLVLVAVHLLDENTEPLHAVSRARFPIACYLVVKHDGATRLSMAVEQLRVGLSEPVEIPLSDAPATDGEEVAITIEHFDRRHVPVSRVAFVFYADGVAIERIELPAILPRDLDEADETADTTATPAPATEPPAAPAEPVTPVAPEAEQRAGDDETAARRIAVSRIVVHLAEVRAGLVECARTLVDAAEAFETGDDSQPKETRDALVHEAGKKARSVLTELSSLPLMPDEGMPPSKV